MHWFHQLSLEQALALLEVMMCGIKNRFKSNCLTNRVVNYVVSANTTNVFKNRLDKF